MWFFFLFAVRPWFTWNRKCRYSKNTRHSNTLFTRRESIWNNNGNRLWVVVETTEIFFSNSKRHINTDTLVFFVCGNVGGFLNEHGDGERFTFVVRFVELIPSNEMPIHEYTFCCIDRKKRTYKRNNRMWENETWKKNWNRRMMDTDTQSTHRSKWKQIYERRKKKLLCACSFSP